MYEWIDECMDELMDELVDERRCVNIEHMADIGR